MEREGWCLCFLIRYARLAKAKKSKKQIKEAERRQTLINIRRILRCGARLARRARLSAFHRGSHLRELFSSQRLSFRPGFLGRGLNGRYPPSPVPVQGSTSHPGHSARGPMPKPPGNGVYGPIRGHRPRPAAGEYPRPTASLLSEIDSSACNDIGDGCQGRCHCIYDVPCSGDYARLGTDVRSSPDSDRICDPPGGR